MEIIIRETLVDTLNRLASERNKTPENYIKEFTESHLFSRQKRYIAETIEKQKPEDIIMFEQAIKPVNEAIKSRDRQEQPINEETPIMVRLDV